MDDLVVDNVTKEYPSRDRALTVLRGVSMRLAEGENAGILGPSGSGKSTLLHLIGTLDQPTSGTICIGGHDLSMMAEPELAHFRNRHVGFVFQDHHLLPQLSVLENVLVPALAEGRVEPGAVERAHDLLARVGLADRRTHRPAELSGGERERVAVARALIHSPQVVLADEPTGNLDYANAMEVAKLLLELQEQEQTMLLVATHSTELASLLQRRMELVEGRLR